MIVADGGEIESEKSASVRFPLPLRETPLLAPATGVPYVPGATLLAMFTVSVAVPDPVTVGG